MSILATQFVRIVIVLLIPIAIILGAVRLVATEPYLSFEYSKSDFPADPFGFDWSQRLTHAADNLQYVAEAQPLEDLAGQKHNDAQLYNARELKHMQDVQKVYQTAWQIWQAAWILAALCVLALTWDKGNRAIVASSVRTGGILTIGLVAVIGFTAIIAWQVWFGAIHKLFFTSGSWTFDFSNTLIRLFPERFWYDAVLTISSLSVIAGFLVYFVGAKLSNNGPDKQDKVEGRQSQFPV